MENHLAVLYTTVVALSGAIVAMWRQQLALMTRERLCAVELAAIKQRLKDLDGKDDEENDE